ncbi:MAG: hypothetical protein A2750_02960 [Candidatus Yanofskybacteria bacterium RIFCSPHIGHO2_01_FULL_45_42]|uniref:Uncharacterized protein n=2 Tax=Candidatus Yanofskyibacteriota TaxID=1752733 RepID=A0A1F8F3R5_9BACT|nr:MAG: hypothetical protein A2750_02960 [Candidatus Yanofskybacteria bacterium RIFCSPHIGHO2_01_FULL_45_42]OGN28039.1 MAG: hypothetical protein A3B17_02975 [Candidatus Yanofskybacteria bacterium RIFCSPLOWO2_01_FULL_45_72]OGN31653.1 MAG: hypothetical protein A3J01_02000 [Candidatus Yanofskybacteria bacterium RIFCSPLOWO2_02_FULL_45_18]
MQSDNFGLFYGIYESGGEFEPIIAFLLKSVQFVFQNLFLIDELVFRLLVFSDIQDTFKIGGHQLFQLFIKF